MRFFCLFFRARKSLVVVARQCAPNLNENEPFSLMQYSPLRFKWKSSFFWRQMILLIENKAERAAVWQLLCALGRLVALGGTDLVIVVRGLLAV